MSSNASASTLHLDPRPSRRLGLLLLLLHLAVAAGFVLALPPRWSLPAIAVLAVLLWRERRASRPVAGLVRDADGNWWLDGAGPFALQPATLVTPWLIVLVLRDPGGVRRVALLPDCLTPAQWRRLRAALRVEPLMEPEA